MAVFPSGIASDADLYVALDNFGTTLNGAITDVQTTITLTSTTGLPTVGILTIGAEKIKYTGVSGFDITGVTRGFSSTVAAAHADGSNVEFNVIEEHHNVLKDEIIAIETHLGTNGTNIVHIAGTETITGTKTLNSFSGTLAANLAAAGFKLTGLGAGTTNGDSVRYQDVILVAGTNAFGANQSMGGFKLTNLAAATTNGDALRYEQVVGVYALDNSVVHLAGTETVTGQKTFNDFRGTFGADVSAGSHKLTSLANGTVSTDAVAYGQLRILQVVSATSTTTFSTTSSTFQTTNISASITPSSSSNKVLILINGTLRSPNPSVASIFGTISRDGTNLGSATGFSALVSGVTNALQVPCHMSYLDSPATTSSTTYAAQIRNDDNTTSVNFGQNSTQTITLIEVQA